MAQAGPGVGILSALVLQYEVSGFVYKSLDPHGYRELHVMMREGGQMPLFTKKSFWSLSQRFFERKGSFVCQRAEKATSAINERWYSDFVSCNDCDFH